MLRGDGEERHSQLMEKCNDGSMSLSGLASKRNKVSRLRVHAVVPMLSAAEVNMVQRSAQSVQSTLDSAGQNRSAKRRRKIAGFPKRAQKLLAREGL